MLCIIIIIITKMNGKLWGGPWTPALTCISRDFALRSSCGGCALFCISAHTSKTVELYRALIKTKGLCASQLWCALCAHTLQKKISIHSIFTPWVVTSVITSFGVNIEWTGRDFTRWVVNFHSTGVRIEWNSLLNEWNLSLHRWSELFTRHLFREYYYF